jgi:hypothetical protein
MKSLVHCRSDKSQQRVGVELLEASVADLNRFKLRKTHQFGDLKYDPGKYYESKNKNAVQQVEQQPRDDEEIDESDHEDVVRLDKENYEDEIEAPWNQYAWAEELRLRVSASRCHFNAVFQSSHNLTAFFLS